MSNCYNGYMVNNNSIFQKSEEEPPPEETSDLFADMAPKIRKQKKVFVGKGIFLSFFLVI